MLNSIKNKFIFFSISLIILTTVIPMYFLVKQLKENFKERSEIMLQTTVDVVRSSLKLAMMSGNQKDLERILLDISKRKGIYHIRIFDETGNIDYSDKIDEINKSILDIANEHSIDDISKLKNIQQTVKGNIYSSVEPLKNEPLCQNCHKEKEIIAYLDINTGLTESEEIFYTSVSHMVYLAWGFIIILIVGLYFIFKKNIYNPLQKLNIALSDVQKGNLNTKLLFKKRNEITSVYNRFNEMTESLKDSREQIEQLHYDVLQRVNRLKTIGELTSQTAHEINNHIAIIMSRIEYLQLESENNVSFEKFKEDFDTLLNQINIVSTITGNILKYSKKDKNKFEKINLYTLANEIISLVSPILKKKNIKLSNNSVGTRHLINADEIQIKQILTNLINNSVDSIIENGKIEISIFENLKDQIILSVKDDGPGIPANIQKEIFAPFFTTKHDENRTGLGLYIIKKICDLHKANIEILSRENEGTKFTITFNKA